MKSKCGPEGCETCNEPLQVRKMLGLTWVGDTSKFEPTCRDTSKFAVESTRIGDAGRVG